MPIDTGAPRRADIREAATRSLICDLATLASRSASTQDLVNRRLIDHLPLGRAIVVRLLFAVMPGGKGLVPPYPASIILDELDRRRAARDHRDASESER